MVVSCVALSIRAIAAAGVEDELLEVVDVGEAAFVGAECRGTVGITPDVSDVARQRVLAADAELAERRAFKANPGVAIEQYAWRIHVAAGQLELTFHARQQVETVFGKDLLGHVDAPAVAAEPRRVEANRRTSGFIDIGYVAQRRLDDSVEQHVGVLGLDDVHGLAGLETLPGTGFGRDRPGRRRRRFRPRLLLLLDLLEPVVHCLDLGLLLFHIRQSLVQRPDLGLQIAEVVRFRGHRRKSSHRGYGGPDQRKASNRAKPHFVVIQPGSAGQPVLAQLRRRVHVAPQGDYLRGGKLAATAVKTLSSSAKRRTPLRQIFTVASSSHESGRTRVRMCTIGFGLSETPVAIRASEA